MKKAAIVGLFLVVVAMLSSACSSSDDEGKLLKWNCNCNSDACAASEEEAEKSVGSCSGDTVICTPTGDSCLCPGGASVCRIVIN